MSGPKGPQSYLAVYLAGVRGQYWVRNFAVWSEVSPLGCLGSWSFVHARFVFRATGLPSSCAFEGRHAPRSPDPGTNDESPSPQQRPDAARGPKQRGEHQPSKPLAWREKLSRPRSPASTPRFDVPPEQRSWSLNMSWLQFNAGPSPGTYTVCNSTIRQWDSTRLLR